mmetsp:Transcript_3972/g.16867  ORF Transcript_3972/g.16867 Transcript_3972/m.16867 type:complete len:303 (-) Transcript_3972:6-914(-)
MPTRTAPPWNPPPRPPRSPRSSGSAPSSRWTRTPPRRWRPCSSATPRIGRAPCSWRAWRPRPPRRRWRPSSPAPARRRRKNRAPPLGASRTSARFPPPWTRSRARPAWLACSWATPTSATRRRSETPSRAPSPGVMTRVPAPGRKALSGRRWCERTKARRRFSRETSSRPRATRSTARAPRSASTLCWSCSSRTAKGPPTWKGPAGRQRSFPGGGWRKTRMAKRRFRLQTGTRRRWRRRRAVSATRRRCSPCFSSCWSSRCAGSWPWPRWRSPRTRCCTRGRRTNDNAKPKYGASFVANFIL